MAEPRGESACAPRAASAPDGGEQRLAFVGAHPEPLFQSRHDIRVGKGQRQLEALARGARITAELRNGARGFPTVLLYKDGAVVDRFHGAKPEHFVRDFIDRHLDA